MPQGWLRARAPWCRRSPGAGAAWAEVPKGRPLVGARTDKRLRPRGDESRKAAGGRLPERAGGGGLRAQGRAEGALPIGGSRGGRQRPPTMVRSRASEYRIGPEARGKTRISPRLDLRRCVPLVGWLSCPWAPQPAGAPTAAALSLPGYPPKASLATNLPTGSRFLISAVP